MPINKHQSLQISNHISSAMASWSCQSSFDPYDLPRDDEECLRPNNVTETTPRRSDRTARVLTATSLYLNSPPEVPNNWVQINPNLNDYHCDPIEFSSTFWSPDITDWWRQPQEMHSKYPDLSNVACDIFSFILHGVGVEARFSLGRDVFGWRQSKTTGETLHEKVVVRQFAWANNGILAGTDPELNTANTENDWEMNEEPEAQIPHRMAKVYNFLEMWQGSKNLRATLKESGALTKQMTAVGYISDTKEIINASWSLFQYDGPAAFNLPKDLLCRHLCLQRTYREDKLIIIYVCRIRRINGHPVESDKDTEPDGVSDTEDWLNWNRDLDHPNDSEDGCPQDFESDIEHNNCIEDPESPAQLDVSTAPNVPRLIQPTRKWKRQAEKLLVKESAIETRRNPGVKQK